MAPRESAHRCAILRPALATLGAMAFLVFLPACSKPDPAPVEVPATTPEPTPTPTPKPTPTPTPTPSPTPTLTPTPTPTPVVRRTAPDGVFYVTEDVTVRFPGGMMGLPPGTEVKMIKSVAGMAHVTDGTREFDINTKQLTNDLATAAAIQKSSRDAQAASDAFRQSQEAIEVQKQREYTEFLRAHPLGGAAPTPK